VEEEELSTKTKKRIIEIEIGGGYQKVPFPSKGNARGPLLKEDNIVRCFFMLINKASAILVVHGQKGKWTWQGKRGRSLRLPKRKKLKKLIQGKGANLRWSLLN